MAAPQLIADFTSRVGPDRTTNQRASEDTDVQIRGFEQETPRFGFRWFVPVFARHRSLWRDVLLASLAIQVIALTTPLLTQVTIDKVIAHHTYGTLLAVALGFAMFLVFNAVNRVAACLPSCSYGESGGRGAGVGSYASPLTPTAAIF